MFTLDPAFRTPALDLNSRAGQSLSHVKDAKQTCNMHNLSEVQYFKGLIIWKMRFCSFITQLVMRLFWPVEMQWMSTVLHYVTVYLLQL